MKYIIEDKVNKKEILSNCSTIYCIVTEALINSSVTFMRNTVVAYKDRIDVFINAIPSLIHEDYGLDIDLSVLNSEKIKKPKII